MILSKDELIAGKQCVIKTKEYSSPKEYLDKFFEELKDVSESYHFEAITPDQLTKGENGVDITYNRVLVYCVLKDSEIDSYKQVIGLSYTLDGRQPIYKLFKGFVENGTNKLIVFDPNWIVVKEINPDEKFEIDFENLKKIDNENFKKYIDEIKSIKINRNSVSSLLGKWIDKCLKVSHDNGFHTIKLSTKDCAITTFIFQISFSFEVEYL